MSAAGMDLREGLIQHANANGADLSFARYFWRECEPLPRDIIQYQKFSSALKLMGEGADPLDLVIELGISHTSASKWSKLEGLPKLACFLKSFIELGLPKENTVWLTLEHSHGIAKPIGRFIQVPKSVSNWGAVENVMNQLYTPISGERAFTKEYLFGFLLGMILGDGNKSKQGRGHRHLGLVLSKKYDTNLKIGEFTAFCTRNFGLRMSRKKDHPKPDSKPYGFFEWTSQSSPVIDWIQQVAFGLNDGQLTTYDPVTIDWALDAPLEFRLGLIQGIAESDGSVSIASQTVEFWVIPNWDFIIRLLATLGLRGFHNREAVSMVKRQAIASFSTPVFSDYLQTVRWQRLKVMATTPRLEKEERIPLEIRKEICLMAQRGLSVPDIVEEVARTRNLLVSFEAAQRWAKKRAESLGLTSAPPTPLTKGNNPDA